MLAKRIIPCLDVHDGKVVKGVQFQSHQVVGDIVNLASLYSQAGADELVFYDITASSDKRRVSADWVSRVARHIDIPFCVAGGIRCVEDAREILYAGADKISINSPALENPDLINELASVFGSQCVVVGIDSREMNGRFVVCQYTGDVEKTIQTIKDPLEWAKEVASRGAGEIVLNCMNQDGVKRGYDIDQLNKIRQITRLPLIASGGAGHAQHFVDVFKKADVSGALAASVFHKNLIEIGQLKQFIANHDIPIRIENEKG